MIKKILSVPSYIWIALSLILGASFLLAQSRVIDYARNENLNIEWSESKAQFENTLFDNLVVYDEEEEIYVYSDEYLDIVNNVGRKFTNENVPMYFIDKISYLQNLSLKLHSLVDNFITGKIQDLRDLFYEAYVESGWVDSMREVWEISWQAVEGWATNTWEDFISIFRWRR